MTIEVPDDWEPFWDAYDLTFQHLVSIAAQRDPDGGIRGSSRAQRPRKTGTEG